MPQFGTLTEEGFRDIRENTAHTNAVRRLAQLDAKLESYSKGAEELAGASQKSRDAFLAEAADSNELHDEADRHRELIGRTLPSFRIAVRPTSTSLPTSLRAGGRL